LKRDSFICRIEADLEEAIRRQDKHSLRNSLSRARHERISSDSELMKTGAHLLRRLEKQPRTSSSSAAAASPPVDTTSLATSEKKLSFYCERGHSGLCRMHALNAFFQRQKLTEQSFFHLCNKFDLLCGVEIGTSQHYFFIHEVADQHRSRNLLSFIIERDSRYRTEYFPPGTLMELEKLEEKSKDAIVGYFEFDWRHVWYWLKHDGKDEWVLLDSRIGGAVKQRRREIDDQRFGQILVLKQQKEDRIK